MKKSRTWTFKLEQFYLIVFVLFTFHETYGQQQNIPIQHFYQIDLEKEWVNASGYKLTSFQPLLQSRIDHKTLQTFNFPDSKRKWLSKKLFHEHFIQYDSSEIQFFIDPICNFESGSDYGRNERDVNHYINTRGFQLRLNLGQKLSAQTAFRETQANLVSYIHDRTLRSRDAYGQGRVKTFGDDGFDFSMATSAISYSPSSNINIQIGHGKHFIGQGHRSLLLSDQSFSYPFLRLNTSWLGGRLNYQNLYAIFQDIIRLDSDFETEGLFVRKRGSFHFLEFGVNEDLSVGLFEGTVWHDLDTLGNHQVGLNYWLPIVYLNSILGTNLNENESTVGLNLNYRGLKNFNLYGQLASYGWQDIEASFQLGAKYYPDFLPIRLQIEYNSLGAQNLTGLYTHYNAALDHPLGANAEEYLASLVYKEGRWLTSFQANLIQHTKATIKYTELRQSYIVNPSSRMTLTGGIRFRERTVDNAETLYYFIGLTTNLQNLYFDY